MGCCWCINTTNKASANIDDNLQGSKLYLSARFSCSAPDGGGQTHRDFVHYSLHCSIELIKLLFNQSKESSLLNI